MDSRVELRWERRALVIWKTLGSKTLILSSVIFAWLQPLKPQVAQLQDNGKDKKNDIICCNKPTEVVPVAQQTLADVR